MTHGLSVAELGASVLAFVSLAQVIRPLYITYANFKEAPEEIEKLSLELSSIQTLIEEVIQLNEDIEPNSLHKVPVSLDISLSQLCQDVAACAALLHNVQASSVGPGSWKHRLKWLLKEQKVRQLCRRITAHREALANALQIFQWYVVQCCHGATTIGKRNDLTICKSLPPAALCAANGNTQTELANPRSEHMNQGLALLTVVLSDGHSTYSKSRYYPTVNGDGAGEQSLQLWRIIYHSQSPLLT